MPIYYYQATDKDGELVDGQLAASSQEEVILLLARKKFTPIKLELKIEADREARNFTFFERFTVLDRLVLVRNLATTIKAGLSISEALDILIGDTTKSITKKILNSAKINIQNGQPLHQTFAAYPQYFPSIFIGMVKAGELSGELDKTLDELSTHMSKEYALVKKVRSALAYPAVLMAATLGIVVLLLTFVLPRLTKTFTQSNMQLPLVTRVLVGLSKFMTDHWLINIVCFIGLIVGFAYLRKTVPGKRMISKLVFKVPVARELVKKVILVRITRTLAGLIASAMPIVDALELSAASAGNFEYEKILKQAVGEVKNGVPFSETFRKYPVYFPKMLTSLLTVGEKTGTLENVLKTFANFYDEDVENALKDLTTFLEPLLLLFMGLIVGLIAISILMPIYQMVGNFV